MKGISRVWTTLNSLHTGAYRNSVNRGQVDGRAEVRYSGLLEGAKRKLVKENLCYI
jgi:hypothetical protein